MRQIGNCRCLRSYTICKQSGHFASPYCPPDQCEDVVYLNKEETSPTEDTPYLYPTEELAQPCPIHSEGSVAPPIDEEGDIPDPDYVDEYIEPDEEEEPLDDPSEEIPSETDPDESIPPVIIVPPNQ